MTLCVREAFSDRTCEIFLPVYNGSLKIFNSDFNPSISLQFSHKYLHICLSDPILSLPARILLSSLLSYLPTLVDFTSQHLRPPLVSRPDFRVSSDSEDDYERKRHRHRNDRAGDGRFFRSAIEIQRPHSASSPFSRSAPACIQRTHAYARARTHTQARARARTRARTAGRSRAFSRAALVFCGRCFRFDWSRLLLFLRPPRAPPVALSMPFALSCIPGVLSGRRGSDSENWTISLERIYLIARCNVKIL